MALLALAAGCTSQSDSPRIALTDVGFALHLPAPMQQALDSLAPGFHTVRTTAFRSDVGQAAAAGAGSMQALFATIGDLDGDGKPDAVVEGTEPGDSALHVIAIMNGAKPVALDVARFPSWDADAVGIYLAPPPAGRTGAFEVVDYPDASTLYQYKDGAFTAATIGSMERLDAAALAASS